MPKPPGARALAFDILRRVERCGAFASILLQRLDNTIPPREIALTTEIVYGCLRFRLRDEWVLTALAGRPLAEIDPDIALLFRIAAHQILRLDRIPESAAVNEAVEAVRSLPGRGAPAQRRREGGARFLNALLRRVCREKSSLPLPHLPDDLATGNLEEAAVAAHLEAAAQALAVHHSHPPWMVKRWIARFGFRETRALLAANNTPAPLALRVDLAHASREEAAASLAAEGVATAPSLLLPDFLRVVEGAPQRTRAFERGVIYIQDEASGIVARLAGAAAGERVLDACAAPGGKALVLARMVGDAGRVVAGDRHPSRLNLITANARRMGVSNVHLVAGDFAAPPLRALFDAVLVDAPCSGTGVFRRDVESRYRLEPEDLAVLAERQRSILEGVASLVRPGGRLVYSVCSIEPEEGAMVVEAFLSGHAGFKRAGARGLPALAGVPAHFFAPDGSLVTLQHRDALDGFYAAVLVRR